MSKELIKNVMGQYVSNIEIIGHKKSMVIEIKIYATNEEKYAELFNSLKNLDLNGMIEFALSGMNRLQTLGVSDKQISQIEDSVKKDLSKNQNKKP